MPDDPSRRRSVRIARTCIYVALIAAMLAPVAQFQRKTLRNHRKAAQFDAKNPAWTPAVAEAGGPSRPKQHAGAIGRWRKAVRQFWTGKNIYLAVPSGGRNSNLHPRDKSVRLHPNMPFVLILMTPLAYLPVGAMALSWNILKLAMIVATVLMAAELVAHKDKRPADWIIALGLAWALLPIIGDMQHGNTNVFVLGAVAAHLWLFRRGRDLAAGAVLALAICLKMTPAIFVLYWLYQRNWKLLAATVAGLVIFAVVIPAAAVGPAHYATLTQSWLDNLIVPGLVKGAWYPIHVNQSLSGVMSRYFLEGPSGNIFWNPDDNLYEVQDKFGWISLVALSPTTLKLIIRIVQIGLVVLCGWAIGWRKLDRDDGRRALHYGMVVCLWLICNQRTWDHHATVLLLASLAAWQGIGFGKISRPVRLGGLTAISTAMLVLAISRSDVVKSFLRLLGQSKADADLGSDYFQAYGPMFLHFVLIFGLCALLAVALRNSQTPYADKRQRLGRK